MRTLNLNSQAQIYSLVKLGGSIITQENGEVDLMNVVSLSYEIAQYKFPLILVHGGGYLIKKILTENMVKTDYFSEENTAFVAYLRDSLIRLNTALVNSFQGAGVRTVSIPAHSKFSSRDGRIIPNEGLFDLLNTVIKDGKIPVLFGDVLDDEAGGFYFTSSDKIVSCLAKRLKPKMILFLSNVDGVYESYPPKSDFESVLSIVTPSILEQLENKYVVGHGEIYEKLVEAIDCAYESDVCRIINGKIPGNLLGSLYGQLEVGTKILVEITE